jgi:hypothetical protein
MWHRVLYLTVVSAIMSGFVGAATAAAATWIR